MLNKRIEKLDTCNMFEQRKRKSSSSDQNLVQIDSNFDLNGFRIFDCNSNISF